MIKYDELQSEIHAWAIKKGWLDPEAKPRPINGLLMLAVTEVAESVEAHRAGNPACERPGMEHLTHVAEELADVQIRLVQMADEWGFKIEAPIEFTPIGTRVDVLALHWLIVKETVDFERAINSEVIDHQHAIEGLIGTVEFVADQLGVDLAEAVRLKMAFNWTRPTKHGKAC